MTKAHDAQARAGRERTIAAILAAAETLFAERGFTAVTVRDIAEKAGVSHALVHRYLGSKEEIYRAVLVYREETIAAAAADEPDLVIAARAMAREGLRSQRNYLRLIIHSALHGLPYESTSGRFAATERLAELAQSSRAATPGSGRDDELDPRLVIAAVVAMYLGWVAASDWVLPAAGLPDLTGEEADAAFEEVIARFLRDNFPAPRDV